MLIIGLTYLGKDYIRGRQGKVDCAGSEGVHYLIDTRSFETKYTGYTIVLEGEVKEKAKFSAKLAETQFQQLSDSLQQANEFRKALVAGFNSCAVTKEQYGKTIPRFQVLDGIASQINVLMSKPNLTDVDHRQLGSLVEQYSILTQKLVQ